MKIKGEHWSSLKPHEKRCLIVYLKFKVFRRRHSIPPPVAFSLRTAAFTLILLILLPHHPLTIPTAFGAALSFTIII